MDVENYYRKNVKKKFGGKEKSTTFAPAFRNRTQVQPLENIKTSSLKRLEGSTTSTENEMRALILFF